MVKSDRIWYDDDGIARLCGTFTKKDSCGTRSGYAMGCRHDNCRKSGNEYNKQWKREKRGVMFTSIENSRAHLKWLIDKGAIVRRIAEELGIRYSQVWEITTSESRVKIDPAMENHILSLNTDMKHLFMTRNELRKINHPHLVKMSYSVRRYGNEYGRII